MYLGEFICKIDKKNRIFIPAPFRENLKEIILTYIDEDTLIIKSSENWTPDSILNNTNIPKNKLKTYIHYIENNSVRIKLDKEGRIVIPKTIIDKLSFKTETIIIGKIDRFLIINKDKYLEEKNRINESWNKFLASEEGQNFKMSLLFKKN